MPTGVPTVCECGRPWLVRYPDRVHPVTERAELRRRHGMWRYRSFLPLRAGEQPVTLGEGDTPLLHTSRLGAELGLARAQSQGRGRQSDGIVQGPRVERGNHAGESRGSRSLHAADSGNAGVAAAAYGARAGVEVRVYAPASTPPVILRQIELFGATLVLLDGHIGDCGKASRAWALESGAMDLSTLREPYRIEGKKTLGLEIALQLGWKLPDAIIYPTGGGTGLIGMWKAFQELKAAGWVEGELPRMFTVQASGCAPIVQAFSSGRGQATPWPDPQTVASGFRVPGPLGDRIMLRILRESNGGAIAVDDDKLIAAARYGAKLEGIDFAPEGGAAIAAAAALRVNGVLGPEHNVVLFNTGAGWLYR